MLSNLKTYSLTVFFIYTTWCPNSKNQRNNWENLKRLYNNINFVEIDCTIEHKDEDNLTILSKKFNYNFNYKIEYFPTFLVLHLNKVIYADCQLDKIELDNIINKITF